MSDQLEIRPHYLDDPDWDIADDGSEGGNWGALFAHAALVLIGFLGWEYKPVISGWLKPSSQAIQKNSGESWMVAPGVIIDEKQHSIVCGLRAKK
jgi:hypothetical protein